jgi:presenilin-like A22 family membrane protease
MWVMGVIAPAILISAAAYLRDSSVLWQSPLQALALAFLFVGLSVPILNWHSVSSSSVAIGIGYFAAGAALGWLLRKSQRRFLRRCKPPN